LKQANDAHVPVMRSNCEYVANVFVSGGISHQIIDHNQMRILGIYLWYLNAFNKSDIVYPMQYLCVERLPFSVAPRYLAWRWLDHIALKNLTQPGALATGSGPRYSHCKWVLESQVYSRYLR
jgi:hypothetical protein